MKSRTLIIIALALLSFSYIYAQQSFDSDTIVVTRWLDDSTRPMTYDEYVESRDFSPSANIKQISTPTITTDIMIDIFVNEDLYPQIESVLDTFLFDLRLDGYGVNLYTALETQSPNSLRDTLYNHWQNQEIEGVILIGDLTVPWYEMDEPWDPYNFVTFPCDLYFMDLDGTWGDSDYDGIFDSHTNPDYYADIWVGRLYASTMTDYGADEVSILQNYFRKNHQYRIGDLRLTDHALAFIDNDWNTSGWGNDVALAFPNTNAITDIYETSRQNYINNVAEVADSQYEHVLICSHSSPYAHYIYYNEDSYQLFHNEEIESYMMQALSYNLFACSNARFIEYNNMGGWYIYETEYGLLSVGSTKTGSMLCFEDYYWPLGSGASYGQAFLSWTQTDIESCAGSSSRGWFYGMCIQGDPTLKVARFQEPIVYCDYIPGDINGDGNVLGSDVTYSVRYFKGVGEPPPDSCWDEETSGWLYVGGDVNGTCEFLGSDITYLVSYFRGVNDSILHCPRFPILE